MKLCAPAKINWTLEVLGRRPDGYHEVRTVLQTIDLCDAVAVEPADDLELVVEGDAGPLAGEEPASNLAFRMAQRLRHRTGVRRGARITLVKHIPVAAGLGGGSSDAAAVLRGLNALWGLNWQHDALAELAGTVGSDVPFFLVGGAALAMGRGDRVKPLGDGPRQRLIIAWLGAPSPADKTARMYRALTEGAFSDGSHTGRLAAKLWRNEPVADDDVVNAFETVMAAEQPETSRMFGELRARGLRPHLCGAGPSLFLLVGDAENPAGVASVLQRGRWRWSEAHTMGAAGTLAAEDG